MRFLAVTTSFPRHSEDHAGRFVHDLHAGLMEEGHRVVTFCPGAADAPPCEETEAGEVRRVAGDEGLFYGDGMEANWTRARRPLMGLRRWMRATTAEVRRILGPGDVLIGHWVWPGVRVAVRAAGRGRTPILGVAHGGDLHLLARPVVGRMLARGVSGRLHGALCTTRRGAEILERRVGLDPARIAVTPMGIDPALFAPPFVELPSAWPTGFILAIGRLIPIKGFDVLVDAAVDLALPLVILGEGPERAALAGWARDRGVDLLLHGPAERPLVAAALAAARVLCVPSRTLPSGRSEGFPVVAVEALAVGTPVVATATGGMVDHLPAQDLVPPDDPAALHRALRDSLAGPRRAPPVAFGIARRDTARTLLGLVE